MNFIMILISSQLTQLKPTSQVVRLTCIRKVSIPLRTLFFLLSILKTLPRHHSVSRITHLFLKIFPQKGFRQLRTSSEEDINLPVIWPVFLIKVFQ
jgi:hypothetical protein